MIDKKELRLSKLAREFNVGITTIVEFLKKKGHEIESNPNTKVVPELYDLLLKEYSSDISAKKESEKVNLHSFREKKEIITLSEREQETVEDDEDIENEILIKDTSTGKKGPLVVEPKKEVKGSEIKVVGKIELDKLGKSKKTGSKPTTQPVKSKEEKTTPSKKQEPDSSKAKAPEEGKKETKQKKDQEKAKESKKTPVVEEERLTTKPELESDIRVVGKIDLDSINQRTRPAKKTKKQKDAERKERLQQQKGVEVIAEDIIEERPEVLEAEEAVPKTKIIRAQVTKLSGPTVVGKINLPVEERKKPVASSSDEQDSHRKKRKRIRKDKGKVIILDKNKPIDQKEKKPHEHFRKDTSKKKRRPLHQEVSEEDVQKQIKDTLARLTSKGKSKTSKYRREKRDIVSQRLQEEIEQQERNKNILQVTEFVSVNELATMMSVPVTQVIATCMNMGLFVSINQRLDAETMALVADEFNYKVEFVSIDLQEAIKQDETEDRPEDLKARPPIVTVGTC